MKQRSTIVYGLLALVLAFGVITGCEGPAGPGGPSGTEGFNGDELAFIHANGFAVAVQRMLGGVTNGGAITAQGATVTWALNGAVTLNTDDVPLNIPAGVTFDIVTNSNTITVGTVALTVNGGPGSVFKVSGSGALITSADAASRLTVNVPTLVLGGAPTLDGASTVNFSGVSTFDLTAPGAIDTFFTNAGVTNTAGKEVTVRTSGSFAAGTQLAKLTVATGTLTLPDSSANDGTGVLTAPVTLSAGVIAADSNGSTINGDVTASGASSFTTGPLALSANKKLTVSGGAFAGGANAITAPGGIELAGGSFAGTGTITADVAVTGDVAATGAITLASGNTLSIAPNKSLSITGLVTLAGGGNILTVSDGATLTYAHANADVASAETVNLVVESTGTLKITADYSLTKAKILALTLSGALVVDSGVAVTIPDVSTPGAVLDLSDAGSVVLTDDTSSLKLGNSADGTPIAATLLLGGSAAGSSGADFWIRGALNVSSATYGVQNGGIVTVDFSDSAADAASAGYDEATSIVAAAGVFSSSAGTAPAADWKCMKATYASTAITITGDADGPRTISKDSKHFLSQS
jgi:hypothetical protein